MRHATLSLLQPKSQKNRRQISTEQGQQIEAGFPGPLGNHAHDTRDQPSLSILREMHLAPRIKKTAKEPWLFCSKHQHCAGPSQARAVRAVGRCRHPPGTTVKCTPATWTRKASRRRDPASPGHRTFPTRPAATEKHAIAPGCVLRTKSITRQATPPLEQEHHSRNHRHKHRGGTSRRRARA